MLPFSCAFRGWKWLAILTTSSLQGCPIRLQFEACLRAEVVRTPNYFQMWMRRCSGTFRVWKWLSVRTTSITQRGLYTAPN